MFARAVRINRAAGPWQNQVAYVFAPDDILMRKIVDDIELEQLRHATESNCDKPIIKKSEGKKRQTIKPIGSAGTRQRNAVLNSQAVTPKQKKELLLREMRGAYPPLCLREQAGGQADQYRVLSALWRAQTFDALFRAGGPSCPYQA